MRSFGNVSEPYTPVMYTDSDGQHLVVLRSGDGRYWVWDDIEFYVREFTGEYTSDEEFVRVFDICKASDVEGVEGWEEAFDEVEADQIKRRKLRTAQEAAT
jgi:hypothetical protein